MLNLFIFIVPFYVYQEVKLYVSKTEILQLVTSTTSTLTTEKDKILKPVFLYHDGLQRFPVEYDAKNLIDWKKQQFAYLK